MRIIAGAWKGCRLVAPAGEVARPTTDRVKESIFNLMGMSWSGGVVVDLFAGSGALGLEALSRGADSAIFVDKSAKSIAAIRENRKRCLGPSMEPGEVGAAPRVDIWRMDWKAAWRRVEETIPMVDWVFVDPPYALELWTSVLETVDRSSVQIAYGIVCEHPRRQALPVTVGGLQAFKQKAYGDICVTMYKPVTGEV